MRDKKGLHIWNQCVELPGKLILAAAADNKFFEENSCPHVVNLFLKVIFHQLILKDESLVFVNEREDYVSFYLPYDFKALGKDNSNVEKVREYLLKIANNDEKTLETGETEEQCFLLLEGKGATN